MITINKKNIAYFTTEVIVMRRVAQQTGPVCALQCLSHLCHLLDLIHQQTAHNIIYKCSILEIFMFRFNLYDFTLISKHLNGRFEGMFPSVCDSVRECMQKNINCVSGGVASEKGMRERLNAF